MITFITLTILHWITAYFTCRHMYTTRGTDGPGLIILYVPVLGWFIQWLFWIGAIFAMTDSSSYKHKLYRIPPRSKSSSCDESWCCINKS